MRRLKKPFKLSRPRKGTGITIVDARSRRVVTFENESGVYLLALKILKTLNSEVANERTE